MSDEAKEWCAEKWARDNKLYEGDYIGISSKTGEAVFNYLVMVADRRAYDVSRKEYQDDITIKRGIESIQSANIEVADNLIELNELREVYNSFIEEFENKSVFFDRMKLLCDMYFTYPEFYVQYSMLLNAKIPIEYQNYINLLGFERIRSLGYQKSELEKFISDMNKLQTVSITTNFQVGSKYSKAQIKEMLREFYIANSISKTPKASDLEDYFILKTCKVKINDKWENGFEIVSLK
jgi:hypothetical protein